LDFSWLALVGLIVAVAVFYAWQVGRRMKVLLVFRLKRLGVSLLFYSLGVLILPHYNYTIFEVVAFSSVLSLAAAFFLSDRPTFRAGFRDRCEPPLSRVTSKGSRSTAASIKSTTSCRSPGAVTTPLRTCA